MPLSTRPAGLGRQIRRCALLAFPMILGVCVMVASLRSTRADDPPQNDPPVIDAFHVEEHPGDVFVIYGHVSDPDDPVEDLLVVFGGVFADYGVTAVTDANGNFSTGAIMPFLQNGMATADTEDIHGAPAETAFYYVIVTPP